MKKQFSLLPLIQENFRTEWNEARGRGDEE